MTSTDTAGSDRTGDETAAYVAGRLAVLIERIEVGDLTDPAAIVERSAVGGLCSARGVALRSSELPLVIVPGAVLGPGSPTARPPPSRGRTALSGTSARHEVRTRRMRAPFN